jgi:hypothetical protein
MDSQKAANWSQIIGTVFAAILLGYAVWDHLPNENQSGNSVAWGDTTKGYIPPRHYRSNPIRISYPSGYRVASPSFAFTKDRIQHE